MDKIYSYPEFKGDSPVSLYRFTCDCLSVEDSMDILVEGVGKDNEDKFITITMDLRSDSFFKRIKYAWLVLFNKWSWREYIVHQSEQDYEALSEIFNPNKKYSELP